MSSRRPPSDGAARRALRGTAPDSRRRAVRLGRAGAVVGALLLSFDRGQVPLTEWVLAELDVRLRLALWTAA